MATDLASLSASLLTTDELASVLKVSPDTVRDWRKKGTGPRGLKVGHAVRYPMGDVMKWIADQNAAVTS